MIENLNKECVILLSTLESTHFSDTSSYAPVHLNSLSLSNLNFKQVIAEFLCTELGQYRDPIEDILACLDYVSNPHQGGEVFLLVTEEALKRSPANLTTKDILSCVVVAKTHMRRFVPEYLLVYIATSEKARNQGIGRKMIALVQDHVKEGIALHVEHDNPAKKLYERLGFHSKYAEMRWVP